MLAAATAMMMAQVWATWLALVMAKRKAQLSEPATEMCLGCEKD